MNSRPPIPSPPGGTVRHIAAWLRDPLEQPVRWTQAHGDLVRISCPGPDYIFVSHPDLIEQVLVRSWKDYRKDVYTRGLRRALGHGLVTSEGDTWKRHRSLVQPAFHKQRLAGYHETMARFAEEHVADWEIGEERDLHVEFTQLTFRIVAATLFGSEVTPEMNVVGHALELLSDDFASFELNIWPSMPEWIPTPRSLRRRKVMRDLDGVVHSFIEQRRADPGDDLLSAMISAKDDGGMGFDAAGLRDEAITLMLAGHETTSAAVTLTFELLARNPGVFDRLHAELTEVLGDGPLTPEALPRLTYTDAVVREAMRVYPPVYAMGREALRDTDLGGHTIKAGDQLALFQWVVHRDERWWTDPLTFRPERWLEGKPRHRFAWFPFGGGPRVCVGARFALAEAVLLVAAVARRFRPQRGPEPIELQPSVTLRPKNGLPTTLAAP